MSRVWGCVVGVVALGVTSAASAQAPRRATSAHTTIDIVSSVDRLETGRDAWLGVRFTLEPGWHIYWQNPGDSGGPPVLLWTAPTGVTIGEPEWPVPERIPTGPLTNYGYHVEALLPVPMRVSAAASGPVVLDATWMVCKDVCVPGRARVALGFPRATATQPDEASAIADARRRVPASAPQGWKATLDSTMAGLQITVTAPRPLKPVDFFPLTESVADAGHPRISAANGAARIVIPRTERRRVLPDAVEGVLVLADGSAYHIVARHDIRQSPGRVPR